MIVKKMKVKMKGVLGWRVCICSCQWPSMVPVVEKSRRQVAGDPQLAEQLTQRQQSKVTPQQNSLVFLSGRTRTFCARFPNNFPTSDHATNHIFRCFFNIVFVIVWWLMLEVPLPLIGF
jgi:hypothetical protein